MQLGRRGQSIILTEEGNIATQYCNLACPAAENRYSRLHVLFLFLILYLLLTIPVKPIISKRNGPIFAKISGLVELWL